MTAVEESEASVDNGVEPLQFRGHPPTFGLDSHKK
jgi:hypothetical protein